MKFFYFKFLLNSLGIQIFCTLLFPGLVFSETNPKPNEVGIKLATEFHQMLMKSKTFADLIKHPAVNKEKIDEIQEYLKKRALLNVNIPKPTRKEAQLTWTQKDKKKIIEDFSKVQEGYVLINEKHISIHPSRSIEEYELSITQALQQTLSLNDFSLEKQNEDGWLLKLAKSFFSIFFIEEAKAQVFNGNPYAQTGCIKYDSNNNCIKQSGMATFQNSMAATAMGMTFFGGVMQVINGGATDGRAAHYSPYLAPYGVSPYTGGFGR